jgi:lauroyl/myristoyl acyltransferase
MGFLKYLKTNGKICSIQENFQMLLHRVINSQKSGRLAFKLAKFLPPSTGNWLSVKIARYFSSKKELPMVQAIRINQWVVNGERINGDKLDAVVLETLNNYVRSMYSLFHYWDNVSELEKLMRYSPESEMLIDRIQQKKQGTMVVFLHSSNFDVSLRGASRRGLDGLVLSLPETNEAIEWQHSLRKSSGLEIKPATISVLREAADRLKAGETVVTGLDRPLPESKYRPKFFGRPTPLPVHYIYLALKAEVPVAVATAIRENNENFKIFASNLIGMEKLRNRSEEVIYNAEKVLRIAEDFIKQAPTQWTVLHPLWPEEALNLPS